MSGSLRALRSCEHQACSDLWHEAFDYEAPGYFLKYFDGDPFFSNEYVRVFEEDRRILSCAVVCRREIRVGRSTVLMGGIANVATALDARGRGLATRVLEDCISVMERDGFDLSILYSELTEYYGRLGWESVPGQGCVATLKTRLPQGDNEFTVRCFRPDDIARICHVYDVYNERRGLSMVRTPEYFSKFILPDAPDFLVAEDSGRRICAYIDRRETDGMSVLEAGWLPGSEKAFEQLMVSAASSASQAGVREISVVLPDDPHVQRALEKIADNIHWRPWHSAMVRIIDLHGLMRKILPELSVRAAGVSGEFAVASRGQRVDILVSPGEVRIVPQAAREVVELSQAQLFGLIFGQSGATDLGIKASESILSLFGVMFPKQPSIYWSLDHF